MALFGKSIFSSWEKWMLKVVNIGRSFTAFVRIPP
jgi:hypothetical protein